MNSFTPVSPVELHTTLHDIQHSSNGLESKDLVTTQHNLEHTAQHTTQPSLTPEFLEELIKVIAQSIQPTDPIHYMVILERAATAQWILSTSEVKQLIGVEPRTQKGKNTFKRGCFIFVKCGKVGGQTGWRVMKKIESENPYKV